MYIFTSRTPSKTKASPNKRLMETPPNTKGSFSKKPVKGDIESDIDDSVPSKTSSKTSGKKPMEARSQVDTTSDTEALMSPFQQFDPRRSSKKR